MGNLKFPVIFEGVSEFRSLGLRSLEHCQTSENWPLMIFMWDFCGTRGETEIGGEEGGGRPQAENG